MQNQTEEFTSKATAISQGRFTPYRIARFDSKNWSLEEYRKGVNPRTKQPSEYWANIGFFGRIEEAMPTLINLLLEVPDAPLAEQVQSLADQLEAVKAKIVKIVRQIEND